jgi:hypothetical protein
MEERRESSGRRFFSPIPPDRVGGYGRSPDEKAATLQWTLARGKPGEGQGVRNASAGSPYSQTSSRCAIFLSASHTGSPMQPREGNSLLPPPQTRPRVKNGLPAVPHHQRAMGRGDCRHPRVVLLHSKPVTPVSLYNSRQETEQGQASLFVPCAFSRLYLRTQRFSLQQAKRGETTR